MLNCARGFGSARGDHGGRACGNGICVLCCLFSGGGVICIRGGHAILCIPTSSYLSSRSGDSCESESGESFPQGGLKERILLAGEFGVLPAGDGPESC